MPVFALTQENCSPIEEYEYESPDDDEDSQTIRVKVRRMPDRDCKIARPPVSVI
jgi:hypothetical protein